MHDNKARSHYCQLVLVEHLYSELSVCVYGCDDVTRYVQGSCLWADGGGRLVRLTDTSLLTLSEVERRALQQAAFARLHQILGICVKIPEGECMFLVIQYVLYD